MGPQTRHLCDQLRSSAFVRFLEQLTGIDGLVPSPHFDGGGGLCAIEPGCRLRVHADYNRNERIRLDRRINLLLYLNKDWREGWGGQLELWDRHVTYCGRRILPLFSRCVVFATNDHTLHGHPDPVRTPDGRAREGLILYYYTNGRPAAEASPAARHRVPSSRSDRAMLTLPATMADLVDPDTIQALFKALKSHGVEYVLVGAVALDVLGIGRLTEDIACKVRPMLRSCVSGSGWRTEMPVRKFRTLDDAARSLWLDPDDDRIIDAARRRWALHTALAPRPRARPTGVFKFRTLAEKQRRADSRKPD